MISIYLIGFMLMFVFGVVMKRRWNWNNRTCLWVALIWPVSLVPIVFAFLLWKGSQ